MNSFTMIFITTVIQVIYTAQPEPTDILRDKKNLKIVADMCNLTMKSAERGEEKLKSYEKMNLPKDLMFHLRDARDRPIYKKLELQKEYGNLPPFVDEPEMNRRLKEITNPIWNFFGAIGSFGMAIYDLFVNGVKRILNNIIEVDDDNRIGFGNSGIFNNSGSDSFQFSDGREYPPVNMIFNENITPSFRDGKLYVNGIEIKEVKPTDDLVIIRNQVYINNEFIRYIPAR